MRSRKRLAVIAAIALGAAPGTFVRTAVVTEGAEAPITITTINDYEGITGSLEVRGAWQLTARHPLFGGFSSLVDGGEGKLFAGTDRGWLLTLPIPDREPSARGTSFANHAEPQQGLNPLFDLESMTRDPETDTLWTAYEGRNTLQRDRASDTPRFTRRAPSQMREWSNNSGPETFERLPDGRFIVLAEAPVGDEWPNRASLLFPSDPVEDVEPLEFVIDTPPKYSPVDATALPDGTVLILLRRVQLTIPATFDASIMHANPAEIEEGGVWNGDIIAEFSGSVFGENFEGIAFVPDASGESGDIYLTSDDNFSVFQRSLLVRLAWPSMPEPEPEEDEAHKKGAGE